MTREVVRVRGQSAQGPVGTGTDHPADDGDLGRRTAEGLLKGAVEPGGGLAGAAGGSGAVGVAGVEDLTIGRFPTRVRLRARGRWSG
ncbi:hypothetical protein ABT086_28785, partial [Streptomyces mirabilis]